ncbi:MAG: hypothetical protein DMG32_25590 [Acidobacteria bacterium]|nr:MAG: hypothetical protein DMG32_25590 [Acidobacteriota bacterium]
MGRGAQTQTTQMTDQQLANQNAMNRALHNQGQSLSNTSAGGYQSLLANPGYTPAQQSAITNQSMGALASAFGALAQSAANRLARTRNSAGYGDLLDELAREQGRQTASVAQQSPASSSVRAPIWRSLPASALRSRNRSAAAWAACSDARCSHSGRVYAVHPKNPPAWAAKKERFFEPKIGSQNDTAAFVLPKFLGFRLETTLP